jgi:tRNA(fMet)-specific endonuclease VapC
LDTSTLSDVMRGRYPEVAEKAVAYLDVFHRFTFSILTRYEILRGLYSKQAAAQIERFEGLSAGSEILPLSDAVIVRGAEIYAVLRRRGERIEDADVLIAATALVHGLALVTENARHFKRIEGLGVESWRSVPAP